MKVCQKCETKVANNAKVCKNCGADVTKAEIIKTDKQVKKSSTVSKPTTKKSTASTKKASAKTKTTAKKSETKKTTTKTQSTKKSPNKKKTEVKSKTKSTTKKTPTSTKKTSTKKVETNKKKPTTKKPTTKKTEAKPKATKKNNIEKAPKVEIIKNQDIIIEEPKLSVIKANTKKGLKVLLYYIKIGIIFIATQIYELLKTIYNFLKSEVIFIAKALVEIVKFLYHYLKVVALFISQIALKVVKFTKNEVIVCSKASAKSVFDGLKSTGRFIISIPSKTKTLFKNAARSISGNHTKRKEKRINKQYAKYEKRQEQLQLVEEIKEEEYIPKNKKKRRIKIAITSTIVLIILVGSTIYVKSLYEDLLGRPVSIVPTHKALKATTEKVFSMGDVITYKDVDYQVVKVETSNGNAYKSPKPGNQFLIVTIYIKNNSKEKKYYSYENWTMSNSKKEEKKRIFTSINVDTALYSGELVRGGIKTGSMVFEQPTDDQKLKMNFYELKKDEDGNEILDESKRVFSVSVKDPKPMDEQEEQKADLKVIKTNEEKTS